MILSNCTKSRTFSRDVYGDCFCPHHPKVTFLSDKLSKSERFYWLQIIPGMLRGPSEGRSEKDNIKISGDQQGCAYVLPAGFMLQQPHTGQTVISKSQTAFNSSAIDIPVYLCRNFWYPCSLKMSFRFCVFVRLLRKP